MKRIKSKAILTTTLALASLFAGKANAQVISDTSSPQSISVKSAEKTIARHSDSTLKITTFSGSVGITNNGFSIVPTFSLNSPSALVFLAWRKNRFSIEPDIRLTLDARKGGMIFWLRYRLVDKKKFSLRVGTHPAYNFGIRNITENGIKSEITQARRFIASEIVPNYQITSNWSIGMYYLQGNGLQKDGPRTTHFLTFNTSISNINLGGDFQFQLIPSVYYLYLDGKDGNYFTATGVLTKKNIPFNLQSTINKTFSSNITGNKNFLWNVTLSYYFSKNLLKI
jgi:hypothetical protein